MPDVNRLESLVDRLTLEQKVAVLTGRDGWSTRPLPSIGLRSMVLSDGPSGVRGDVWDERSPSLNLPCSSSLSATWDVAMAYRFGAVAAVQARAKGVDVLLGPFLNIQRSPVGGRHFEAFSEDPLLTSRLAVGYVSGVQDCGVAATPKAYVGNDSETERFRVDVRISDRALREVYLQAFEEAVTEARAWVVMSAYNSVNGATMTENDLLATPLNDEWGFDGVVVSDWLAVRSLESARRPQDLAMPGPTSTWSEELVEGVRNGSVEEADVDRKVARLLLLAARVGALDDVPPPPGRDLDDVEDGAAFAREAAAAGMVLLRNQTLLPLEPDTLTRIAVIGESAVRCAPQGGGSATVIPASVSQPFEALAAVLPGVEVVHHLGATVRTGFDPLDPDRMRNAAGGPGVRVSYRDESGLEVHAEDRSVSTIINFGGEDAIPGCVEVVISTAYTPEVGGSAALGFAHPGHGTLLVDGAVVLDERIPEVGEEQIDAFFDPPYRTADVATVAGEPLGLELHYRPGEWVDGVEGSFAVILGSLPQVRDDDALVADAVGAARDADVAVVVVGTTARIECEGYDRADLRLPGHQDALVAAVAAANPRTVVVVNAGAPVEMPWRDDVGALLLSWFPGQEFGLALADVLLGRAEPGGRLPTTWPATLADAPVTQVAPTAGRLSYDEGIHVGYRAWLRAGRTPAYPFGHGLGYTTWDLSDLSAVPTSDGGAVVRAALTNTGARPGKQVVQVYAERPESPVERPARWLVGFATADLDPGAGTEISIELAPRRFAYWDSGWRTDPGSYRLHVGWSVTDIVASLDLIIEES